MVDVYSCFLVVYGVALNIWDYRSYNQLKDSPYTEVSSISVCRAGGMTSELIGSRLGNYNLVGGGACHFITQNEALSRLFSKSNAVNMEIWF